MKNCPSCARPIHEAAIFCSSCGAPTVAPRRAAPVPPPRNKSKVRWILASFVAFIVVLLMLASSNRPVKQGAMVPSQSPASAAADPGMSYESMLADINGGGASVQEFKSLLDSLQAKCSNSRKEISDVCVRAQEMIRKKGRRDSLLEVVRALDGCIPGGAEVKLDIKEIAAAYIALRTR